MMAKKITFVWLMLVATFVGQTSAVDLIELTDANQATLDLELSKAVGGIQSAYKNSFKFHTASELKKFLSHCELAKAKMAGSDDSAFKGLAKQIKNIMSEPSIKAACSVTLEQIDDDFDQLDDLSRQDTIYAPLSTKVFNLLVGLNDKIKGDSNLNVAAGHLVKEKTDETIEQLLKGAPGDIEMMVGEVKPKTGPFDFDTHYKKFCEISLIKPVCKLVRGTDLEVSAIAADINKFSQSLKSGGAEVAENVEKSGVSLDELKSRCGKLQRDLRPIGQINKYLSSDLMNTERLSAHRQTDPSLDSYMALFDLCQQALEV